MKKFALILAVMAAVMLSACGGKQSENVQTQAAQATQAGGPAADAVEEAKPDAVVVALPDEYEAMVYEGVVVDYVGNVIVVDGDGADMSFDISRHEDDPENPVIRGCYVEVSYADAPENGVYPADAVSLLNDNEEYASAEGHDPYIYGKLLYMDLNEISLMDDAGRDISFDGSIARTVSFADIKPGDPVVVTYAGSIYNDDEAGDGAFNGAPIAIKVVAADAEKSEDAQANYIDGVVYALTESGCVLSTSIDNLECSGDASVFAGIEEEDAVRVYYAGALADLVIAAEKIEKR